MKLKTKSMILGIALMLAIAMGVDIGLHWPNREIATANESLESAYPRFADTTWAAVYLWAVEKDLGALLDIPIEDVCLCELPVENDFFLRVIEKVAGKLGAGSPGNTQAVLEALQVRDPLPDFVDRFCIMSMMPIDLEDWLNVLDDE